LKQKVSERAGTHAESSPLEFIQQENPDLLIADIRMPDMDGLELIEQIRMFNDVIRIIVLSGYDTFYYAQKAMQYGAERYILKPIEEDELIVHIFNSVYERFSQGRILLHFC